MQPSSRRMTLAPVATVTAVLIGLVACSSGNGPTGGADAGATAGAGGLTGIWTGLNGGDGSAAGCPSSCAELGANCGTVTDTPCGGVVDCGNCPVGQVCGGAGVHNRCARGTSADGCAPLTCAEQGVSCGPAGDGCDGILSCGTCMAPQSCGGSPSKPGECGCTGVCAQIPACAASATTTLTGAVYDPAGVHPLYNALVYIPNNPQDPGLQPFTAGFTCDVCGAAVAGTPLVSAYTNPDGTFTLTNVPVGASIPLVVQLGRWRKQLTVNIATACGVNPMPAPVTMPRNHTEGDIPRIAFLTGALDPVECMFRKMGVDDSEFTDPGAGGNLNLFVATSTMSDGQGTGAVISGSTPGQEALWPLITQYDLVVIECEGYAQAETASDLAALKAYADSGGRLFLSDYASMWLYQNGNYAQAANWSLGQAPGGLTVNNVSIDLTTNPKGAAFDQWLELTGVSTAGSDVIPTITPAYHNTNGVVTPTQEWLDWGSGTPLHFSFNTPVGAPSASQCGRIVFSDWHANASLHSHLTTFPDECGDVTTMTPQETILEFMLFDLSACVQPYTALCTPTTCAAAKVACGPAGDGCGSLLECGACPTGEFCGGGGPGQCGTALSCKPATCASQGIECGPAGDGCGNMLNCGSCSTGLVCGLSTPGKCSALVK